MGSKIKIKREMMDVQIKQEVDVVIKQEPPDDDAPGELFHHSLALCDVPLKIESSYPTTSPLPPLPKPKRIKKLSRKPAQKSPRTTTHAARQRPRLPGPLSRCPGCRYYSYTDELDAWRHWCEYHIGHTPPYPVCKFPKCGWSPDGEEKREHMTSHAKIHFPRAEHFKCEVCGKGYLRNSDRKKHQRGMHKVAC